MMLEIQFQESLENLPKDSSPPEISKIDSDSNAMWLNLTQMILIKSN